MNESILSFCCSIEIYCNTAVINSVPHSSKNLENLTENKDLVVISGDKDSCVVILKRSDYNKKLQSMIDVEMQAIAHVLQQDPSNDLFSFTIFLKFHRRQ